MSEISQFSQGLHEECGVFGMYDKTGATDMVSAVYSALYALQHRGQESCGIALNVDGVLSGHRDLGLVSEVFTKRVLEDLPRGAKMATGHVRYATAGQRSRSNAQPMVLHHCKGAMAVCHNGNLVNAPKLRRKLEMSGSIFHGTSDTEVIAYLLTQNRLLAPNIEMAVSRTMDDIEGAYSLVIMTHTKLIAARDPWGFRPLCMGRMKDGSVVFASESCALDAIGAKFERDILPGELVRVDATGVKSFTDYCGGESSLCVYEYVYFSRPDSIPDGNAVYNFRERAGELLAKHCPADADVVFGIPDGGVSYAQGYARVSGLPLRAGIIKNKFSSRNLFSLEEEGRQIAINLKYNVLKPIVWGKRVVIVDDSIVRGKTSSRLIRMLKNAGATEVHVRIASPRILHSCPYGIQMPKDKNLFAVGGKTEEEMCRELGCDSIGFLPLECLPETGLNKNFGYCTACFSGKFPL